MDKPVKIQSLEIENVKRVKALTLDFSGNALTVIGGNNAQGKTSVLDAICGTLGGDKFKPTNPVHDGAEKGSTTVILSNGIKATRTYTATGSYLKVEDPAGAKGGQQLLNDFVEGFALCIDKFLKASDKEKASTLLRIIGVEGPLRDIEIKHDDVYQERHAIGREKDRLTKYAAELPHNDDLPDRPLEPSEILDTIQAKVAVNAENERIRNNADAIRNEVNQADNAISHLDQQITTLEKQLTDLRFQHTEKLAQRDSVKLAFDRATQEVKALKDEDTQALKVQLKEIEDTNARIRENLEKERAEQQAEKLQGDYNAKTGELDALEAQKADLLAAADLPYPGLSVDAGKLTFQGKAWDCMSSAEQLQIATAIVRRLNPSCGFVLVDKVEAMDLPTLQAFGAWLEAEGLQAITTRVSTGGECSIIIENGVATTAPIENATPVTPTTPAFTPGEF